MCVWLIVRTHGALEVVLMTGLILLFNGAWLTHFFALRVDLFRSQGRSVEAFVSLTRRRLATEVRWARFARRSIVALALPLLPWSVWVAVIRRDVYFSEPWRAVVGFGTAAAILAGAWIWSRRKERKLRRQQEAFERHMADAELA